MELSHFSCTELNSSDKISMLHDLTRYLCYISNEDNFGYHTQQTNSRRKLCQFVGWIKHLS